MTAAEQKIATSFRAYEEQQSALKKAGAANAVQVGRGRIHSVRAVDIVVYPERNIRPSIVRPLSPTSRSSVTA